MISLRVVRYCSASLIQRSQKMSAIRQAGNYKRPQNVALMPRDHLDALKTNTFQSRTELSNSEWNDVRQTLIDGYKHINKNNVDAVILGVCNEAQQLPLAKDYVRYILESGTQPNLATLGRLLRVYNAAYHTNGAISASEQQEVLDIYAALRKKHDVLDAVSCENLIHGLVTTTQWHEAKELLDMMKLTSTPTISAYTELIVKAFNMSDMQLGWSLLEEMLEQRKQPKCEAFIAYLKEIAKNPTDFWMNLEKFLHFLEQHDLIISEKVVHIMLDLAKKLPATFTATPTKLNKLGKCASCNNFMQNIAISDDQFTKLSDSFLNKVLIRKDVFQKSTPEEVERFKRVVEQTAPYDCVIDGLNVAYSVGAKKPPHVMANLLATVVKYFHNKNKHVLVLGRKHMNNWPKDAMQFIRKNASIFLTNNLTHDDPFLLYATLKSGQCTDFFSRDLMRSHAFLLGPELKIIFKRWQQEHQYSLITQTESGKIIVKEPIRHLICAHKVKSTWHIPYKQEYSANPPETLEVPEKWLCIKFQK